MYSPDKRCTSKESLATKALYCGRSAWALSLGLKARMAKAVFTEYFMNRRIPNGSTVV